MPPTTRGLQSNHRHVPKRSSRCCSSTHPEQLGTAARVQRSGFAAETLPYSHGKTQDKHRLLLSQHINDLGVNPWLDSSRMGYQFGAILFPPWSMTETQDTIAFSPNDPGLFCKTALKNWFLACRDTLVTLVLIQTD